jgi:hypothetical protein
MSRMRTPLPGFIQPCLPSPAPNPPAGGGWIHEIKLDGFRMLARRDAADVRLLTRRGIDWTARYFSGTYWVEFRTADGACIRHKSGHAALRTGGVKSCEHCWDEYPASQSCLSVSACDVACICPAGNADGSGAIAKLLARRS